MVEIVEGFVPPTYVEYQKATDFARLRYKYGLIVTTLSWITLILLIVFVIYYSHELSTNPIRYTMEKYDLKECFCKGVGGVDYYINETSISWKINPIYHPIG